MSSKSKTRPSPKPSRSSQEERSVDAEAYMNLQVCKRGQADGGLHFWFLTALSLSESERDTDFV